MQNHTSSKIRKCFFFPTMGPKEEKRREEERVERKMKRGKEIPSFTLMFPYNLDLSLTVIMVTCSLIMLSLLYLLYCSYLPEWK